MPLLQCDAALFRAFAAGERPALERTYRFYAPRVDAYLRVLAGRLRALDYTQASQRCDLLQEVFLRAFSEPVRQSYDGARPFHPYLCAIARNCLVDLLRRRVREVVLSPDLLLLEPDHDAASDPTDPFLAAVVQHYLSELPQKLRGVYEQRYVRGLAQLGASQALGLTRQQLRSSEARLLRGLRQALAQAGVPLLRGIAASERDVPGALVRRAG
jgi:RNA polymerase sigma factor (sigma-70 family)